MHEVIVTVTNGRIEIEAPYALKDTLKYTILATWHQAIKRWSMPATTGSAHKISESFQELRHTTRVLWDIASQRLLEQYHEESASLTFKHVQGDGKDLPEIPGVRCLGMEDFERPHGTQKGSIEDGENPLYCQVCKRPLGSMGHQRKAYWFAKDREGVLLAMGMGTGKSKVVQALMDVLDGEQRQQALIICPRRAVPVWPDQFKEHSLRDWYVIAPPQRSTVPMRAAYISREIVKAQRMDRPYAVAINTEACWRPGMSDVLKQMKWDALVIDESHKIKSASGKASKWVAGIAPSIPKRILCTGTPMPHSPLDIFAQMRVIDPGVFGTNYHRFRHRYAVMGGFEGRQVVDYKNLEELDSKWGEYAFICGDEVLDLPPVRHLGEDDGYVTELEPKARKAYKELDRDFVTYIKDHPEDDGSVVVGDNALTKLLRLQQVSSGWVKNDEGELVQVSTAKATLLEETLDQLPVREPVIVVCRFQHDLEQVKIIAEKQGRRYGEISGRVNENSPLYGLDGSRMRSDVDIVAVQIQAGGVGIDLTRAAYCVFYSVGYSLGDYDQVLKRTHRPGQVRPVTYIHLIVRDTKDKAVYDALMKRRSLVGACIERARKS